MWLTMDPNYINMTDYADIQMDITEYHPNYTILNDRSDKSSSGVWKHFGTLENNKAIDRKFVYCIQCFRNRKIKKYQRSTSTGNLSKHLRKYHRISLNQTFRIKKESENNTIVSIQKEQSPNDIDDENLNCVGSNGDGEEFLIHDINEILIAEVAKRPLLYNSTACQGEKGLKHQTRRQLWSEIYEALNQLIPYPRLPKIWKNIRDRYHKVRRSVEHAPEDYRPRYRYYDMLSFLDDVKSDQPSPTHRTETGEEFENYVDEFLSTNENAKYIATETTEPSSGNTELRVEAYEPKRKKMKRSCTEVGGNDAQTATRKTLYALANEVIEESHETIPDKNMQHDLNFVPETGTLTILTTSTPYHQQVQPPQAIETNITEPNGLGTQSALKTTFSTKDEDQFDTFGRFVAQNMRAMSNSQSRKLQAGILRLIGEVESMP